MKFIRAKSLSYGPVRPYENVKAIVIHYTGNDHRRDTAEAECRYFASGNTRAAGAHIFVDQKGGICKSVPLSRPAYSVGIWFTSANGAASYWGKLNNYNTVSIEMCDCASRDPSKKMIKALKKVIKYIRKYCPNATKLVRHWDVCGKSCPARMTGKNNARWEKLLRDLGEMPGQKKKQKVVKKAEKKAAKNKTELKTNIEIAEEVVAGKWGNGKVRKQRLTAAGYDYATIQKIVNKMVG